MDDIQIATSASMPQKGIYNEKKNHVLLNAVNARENRGLKSRQGLRLVSHQVNKGLREVLIFFWSVLKKSALYL